MGDLLSRSRNKLIRRLTAQASPSPLKESTPVASDVPPRPQTASTKQPQLQRTIEEQGSPSRSTQSSDRLTGSAAQSETGFSQAKPPPPLIVQEPTPPPLPSAKSPPSKAPSQPTSYPGPQRNVSFASKDPASSEAPVSGSTASVRTREGQPAEGSYVKQMSRRKLWIKRPGASPTLVQANHDDVVDEVRDMVLRKYSNSLGRTFDSPDVTIRILPRERSQQDAERCLAPEESIWQVIDSYYPGGQHVDEALLVDVGVRRTPKPSPRIVNHMNGYFEDARPIESDGDYFPPMPAAVSPNPQPALAASGERRPSISQGFHPHSMAILETGQLPPLPSPGLRNRTRPRYGRQHTSSPTILGTVSKPNIASNLHFPGERGQPRQRSLADHAPTPPPLPTPPLADPASKSVPTKVSTPPLDRVASPRPHKTKSTRDRKTSNANDRPPIDGRRASDKQPTYSFLEAAVPPINVLIVEDNPINLRLLEMFAKKLNVRWSTAMNGRDAVLKWREGGFHLVLMDIQLPIMSGLEATKEIRRLERVNGIGIFARTEGEDRVTNVRTNGAQMDIDGTTESTASTNGEAKNGALGVDDKLDGVFKSPVIIVALTASSLQSDRHEALAAGCNDFLTKPVSFVYLERKVMEWGCMQALIDFDGWRKWKDMATAADEEKAKKLANETEEARAKREKKEARKAAIMAKMANRPG